MTAVGLLARLRTLFDEDIAEFWTDAECYIALTDAQREIITVVAKKFRESPGSDIPLTIRPLLSTVSLTAQNGIAFPLSVDFFEELSIKIALTATGAQLPAFRRFQNENKYYHQNNSYLKSSNTDVFYDIMMPNLITESTLVNGSITLDYIKRPQDINGLSTPVVDPSLDDIAENAIIWWAYSFLLNKAKLDGSNAMNIFTAEVGLL